MTAPHALALDPHDRFAERWAAVGEIGAVRQKRTRQGKTRWYVDFRPIARIFSDGSGSLETEAAAIRVLGHVQVQVAKGHPLLEVLAGYLPAHAKPLLVETRLAAWLAAKRKLCHAGDLSPTYLRELERYAQPDGHFSFWHGRSVLEVDTASVDDWADWLLERGIGPKTRHNVIGAFRAFLSWLKRRKQLRELPDMPTVKVPEHAPTIITAKTQDAILAAIPGPDRGAFLCMARMGLRPGEARALEARDYQDGWLSIERARKGLTHAAPIGPTKTLRVRRLPVDPELGEWLQAHPAPEDRLGGTLFLNPRTGKPWTYWALREAWGRATKIVGVRVSLYEGTKHCMASDALKRGVPERTIQAFLGHADPRSTRRYAKLGNTALVHVLRQRVPSERQGNRASVDAPDPEKAK